MFLYLLVNRTRQLSPTKYCSKLFELNTNTKARNPIAKKNYEQSTKLNKPITKINVYLLSTDQKFIYVTLAFNRTQPQLGLL